MLMSLRYEKVALEGRSWTPKWPVTIYRAGIWCYKADRGQRFGPSRPAPDQVPKP